MAEWRCTYKCGDWRCGSYQFNLYKHDIDQGNLCDVHYWQTQAQKAEATSKEPSAEDWIILRCVMEWMLDSRSVANPRTAVKSVDFLLKKLGRKTVYEMIDQLHEEKRNGN